MAILRSPLPPGNYPFPEVDSPQKSEAVASFEEKVAAFAMRAMKLRDYAHIKGEVRIIIEIQSVVFVEPMSVAKAVLDALSGVMFGKSDKYVRALVISCRPAPISKVNISVGHTSDTDEQLISFEVPNTPVGKGMAFTGRPGGHFNMPEPSGPRLPGWNPPSVNAHLLPPQRILTTRDLSANAYIGTPDEAIPPYQHIDIMVHRGKGDIDNTLRYYINELIRCDHLRLDHLPYIQRYSIKMLDCDRDDKARSGAVIVTGND